MDIHVLHQQGLSIRHIAMQLGISRNTVCAYLRDRQKMPVYTRHQVRPTKLQPYQDYLRSRIEAAKPYWIPATVPRRELKTLGYTGSITPSNLSQGSKSSILPRKTSLGVWRRLLENSLSAKVSCWLIRLLIHESGHDMKISYLGLIRPLLSR